MTTGLARSESRDSTDNTMCLYLVLQVSVFIGRVKLRNQFVMLVLLLLADDRRLYDTKRIP